MNARRSIVDLGDELPETDTYGDKDTLSDIENLIGSGNGDTLTGDESDNIIEGGGGNDIITGGGGTDTASYASDPDIAKVNVTVNGPATDGYGNSDTLTGITNLIGSDFDDTLTGDAGDNKLFGGGGIDTLYGGEGNDILEGGRLAQVELIESTVLSLGSLTKSLTNSTIPFPRFITSVGHLMSIRATSAGPVPKKAA